MTRGSRKGRKYISMEELKKNHNDESLKRRHETTDANAKRVMIAGVGFLGIMVVGLLMSWAVYSVMKDRTPNPGAPATTFEEPSAVNPPPRPWLQASPRDTLLMVRRAEDSVLTSYGWVNKETGIVRVPIDRAIEMVAAKGLPYREPESVIK